MFASKNQLKQESEDLRNGIKEICVDNEKFRNVRDRLLLRIDDPWLPSCKRESAELILLIMRVLRRHFKEQNDNSLTI